MSRTSKCQWPSIGVTKVSRSDALVADDDLQRERVREGRRALSASCEQQVPKTRTPGGWSGASDAESGETDRKLDLAPAGGALDGVKVARADAAVVDRDVDVVLALRLERVVDKLELVVLRAVVLQGGERLAEGELSRAAERRVLVSCEQTYDGVTLGGHVG